MARSAESTRAAILRAAVAEFAELGFAGARVDRIGEASGVSKRMIYVYFGDKDGLFEAALREVLTAMLTAVPVTEDDLPRYAVALFDYLVEHPESLRLTMWRHLERPAAGPEIRELYAEKVAAMRLADAAFDAALGPVDTLVLLQGMAGAWLSSPMDLLAASDSSPMSRTRLGEHRLALAEAARRLVEDRS